MRIFGFPSSLRRNSREQVKDRAFFQLSWCALRNCLKLTAVPAASFVPSSKAGAQMNLEVTCRKLIG